MIRTKSKTPQGDEWYSRLHAFTLAEAFDLDRLELELRRRRHVLDAANEELKRWKPKRAAR